MTRLPTTLPKATLRFLLEEEGTAHEISRAELLHFRKVVREAARLLRNGMQQHALQLLEGSGANCPAASLLTSCRVAQSRGCNRFCSK